MSVRKVLVLGDSPHAAELLEQLDRDPDSQRQSASSELPDLAILAGARRSDREAAGGGERTAIYARSLLATLADLNPDTQPVQADGYGCCPPVGFLQSSSSD